MRDLINLIEGVGLTNRKPGEKFENPEGDVITYQGMTFYPDSGAYESPEELAQGLEQASAELGVAPEMIAWTNTQPKQRGGFAVAHFTDVTNKDYYLGRWFQNINPNRALNNFPHNSIPGGFKYASKVAKKEHTGYKPSEVLTQFKSQTPESILEQITAKFGEGSDEVNATVAFMSEKGPKFAVPKGNMNPEAFRDYFCEMLQPMALVMGKQVSGNANDAAEIFFKQSGYGDCVISFNENVSGNLFDSLLVNSEGKQIKLSSKGKSGAKASVVNLLRSVEEISATPNGQKLVKKYAETIDILNTIDEGKHIGAPLKLAVKYKMITPKEAQSVLSLKGLGPNDTKAIDAALNSKTLQSLYKGRTAKDPSKIIPIEHMIAAIAYKVADYVNENTNFSEAASSILNYSAFVQMWTTMTTSGDQFVLTFEARYPGEAVTGVELSAQKSYMSTQGKGNFVFNILKNGATSKDIEMLDAQVDTKPDPEPDTGLIDTEKLDRAAQARSSITAHAGGVDQEKLGTPKTLGRGRRK